MQKQFYSFLFLFMTTAITCLGNAKTNAAANSGGNIFFLENNGQLKDQYHNPRNDLDFLLRSPGMNLYIGSGHMHYQFISVEHKAAMPADTKKHPIGPLPGDVATDPVYTVYRLDMELAGADMNVTPVTSGAWPYYENYYHPHCPGGYSRAHAFRKITYPGVYPGIDWVIYEKNGILKYDFILHAGANPSDIRIRYKGATNTAIQQDGSLQVTTPAGTITEKAPVAWTLHGHKPVSCHFVQEGSDWTFSTDTWSGSLVLDPALHWATYFGGNDEEDAWTRKVAVDDAGMVYITAATMSISQIATSGAHQTTIGGGVSGTRDAFLAKMHPDGSLLWGTYFGGSEDEFAYGIATDRDGHVYVGGHTESTSGIATSQVHQTGFGGGTGDNFLAQFNDSGQLMWATYYGGALAEDKWGGVVSTDARGNVYLAGTTTSTSGISTPGSHQPTKLAAGGAAYLAKFNVAGQLIWGTYFGGNNGSTSGDALTVDQQGNIYLAGNTTATNNITTTGTHRTTFSGGSDNDVYIAKFDSAGQQLWGTYYGGAGNDQVYSVTTDIDDNVYIGGPTFSDTGIASTGAHRDAFMNLFFGDSYVAKFEGASGVRLWGTYLGPGPGGDMLGTIVSTDPCGKVYASGNAYGFSNLVTPDAMQATVGGNGDGMLVRYSTDGDFEYGTYWGGEELDAAIGLHVDRKGTVWLFGYTSSTTGVATTGGYQQTYGGGTKDAFLVKMLDLAFDPAFTDTVLCIDRPFVIPIQPSSHFNAGNTFTVELSDNTGDFTNAVTIGTASAAITDEVSCLIPAATAPGSGYRIRVIASDPGITTSTCDRNIHAVTLAAPPPVPAITVDGQVLTSDAANGNQWILNNTPVTGATDQEHTAVTSGWYRVMVTDANGCSSVSDSVLVEIPSAVDLDGKDGGAIKVYPSPFSGYLYIQAASSVGDISTYHATVTDPAGRVVHKMSSLAYHNEINLAHLQGGVYFIVISNGVDRSVYRLLKLD